MPTYEYRCEKCGEQFEVFQSFSDRALRRHPDCGGAVEKVLHPRGIVFKGSGFYVTDSRSKSSSSSDSSDSNGSSSDKAQIEPKSSDKGESGEKPTSGQKSKSGDRPKSDGSKSADKPKSGDRPSPAASNRD